MCTNTRKAAKSRRALIHYNGHGVPRPTVNGEIWVFNRVSQAVVRQWWFWRWGGAGGLFCWGFQWREPGGGQVVVVLVTGMTVNGEMLGLQQGESGGSQAVVLVVLGPSVGCSG